MTDFTPKIIPLEDGSLALYYTTSNVIYLGFYSDAGIHIGGHKF